MDRRDTLEDEYEDENEDEYEAHILYAEGLGGAELSTEQILFRWSVLLALVLGTALYVNGFFIFKRSAPSQSMWIQVMWIQVMWIPANVSTLPLIYAHHLQ
jgi:hypothetical protein